MSEPSSVSFDRAAEYYDRTRLTDEASIGATLDLLEGEFRDRGRVLEIGVGTGALALPLAARGIPVTGIDLALPMMRKLIEKASDRSPVFLAQADATLLPFRDASFAGAYARWVLHLIPGWRGAVSELCRVLAPGGTVIIEPGGYRGRWTAVMARVMQEIGPSAGPVGLDSRAGFDRLDEAFAASGAVQRNLPEIMMPGEGSSLAEFFEEATGKVYSWTWKVPDDELRRGLDRVREWAAEKFGDLDAPFTHDVPMAWRAYDLP
jgi:ubiquinone/menaquinone biosynthesis C-methylase UbiE